MKTKLLIVLSLFTFQTSFAKTFNDPVAPSLSPITYCDPNNDGFGVFDLITLSPQIIAAQSGPASNYVVAYYGNATDAQVGANPIQGPYYNINAWSQTIYYRVTNINTSAFAFGQIQLVVNPTPVAIVPDDYHLCDYTGAVGYESFDLTTVIPEVLGSINPSSSSVSFYTNQANAESGINQITSVGNYVNSALGQQTLYVRVTIISTGCYDVVSLHLVVDPLPQATQPNYPQYALCDASAPIGYETFDLASRITSILLGQTGMYVTFFPSLADAQNGTNQISNPSSFVNNIIYVQTLGIRITNASTGCYVISTMDIKVEPLPNLVPPTESYVVCDADQDGAAVFDLTSLIPGLLNGSSYSITFHETIYDAENNSTTIPSPSSYMNIIPFSLTIYARGQDNITGCSTIVPIELQVNPAPVVDSLPSISVCDADANPLNGVTSVDLTQQTAAIFALQPLPASNYVVTYFTTMINAYSGSAPIIPAANYIGSNGETIWYRVENNSSHCYNVGSFQLVVNASPNISLVSNNTLNTVYVDGSNNVVQGLTLDAQLSGNYVFNWQVAGAPILDAISSAYNVNTASPTGASRTFVVTATDLSTGCTASSSIVVMQSSGTPSPLGPIIQPFNPGDTLADLSVTGVNVLWYASAINKSTTTANSSPLPLSTLLLNGAIYYASQTIGGLESIARLPVTVYAALGVPGNEMASLQFAPNPVKDHMTLQSAVVIKTVSVYTMLGQKVFEQNYNDTNISIDLSQLTTGNYILKAQGEIGQKTIRIVKE